MRAGEDHVLNERWAQHTLAGYAALGELEPGFALLDFVVERPLESLSTVALRLDPQLDPYREDPRFDEIIERRERFEAKNARQAAAERPWVP